MPTEETITPKLFPDIPMLPDRMELWTVDDFPDPEIEPTPAMLRAVSTYGVLVTVVVRCYEEGDRKFTRIIDGRRRIAAAKVLHKAGTPIKIPVAIYGMDNDIPDCALIMLNEVRGENIKFEFMAVRRLLAGSHSEKDIAAAIGIPIGTIRKRSKLLKLPEILLMGLESGKIPGVIAQLLATQPRGVQELIAKKYAACESESGEFETITRAMIKEARSAINAQTQSSLDLGDDAMDDAPEIHGEKDLKPQDKVLFHMVCHEIRQTRGSLSSSSHINDNDVAKLGVAVMRRILTEASCGYVGGDIKDRLSALGVAVEEELGDAFDGTESSGRSIGRIDASLVLGRKLREVPQLRHRDEIIEALIACGIDSLEKLKACKRKDLLAIPHLGASGIQRLREAGILPPGRKGGAAEE